MTPGCVIPIDRRAAMSNADAADLATRVSGTHMLDNAMSEAIEANLHEIQERLIEIRVAIEVHNPPVLERAAHRLKSAALAVGGSKLADHATSFQKAVTSGNLDGATRLVKESVAEFVQLRSILRAAVATKHTLSEF
jgi:HPt (histidine-containing phosphotransfer) domain-containing protein